MEFAGMMSMTLPTDKVELKRLWAPHTQGRLDEITGKVYVCVNLWGADVTDNDRLVLKDFWCDGDHKRPIFLSPLLSASKAKKILQRIDESKTMVAQITNPNTGQSYVNAQSLYAFTMCQQWVKKYHQDAQQKEPA